MFIDVHCHLEALEKEGKLDYAIEEMEKADVIAISAGTDSFKNRKTLDYLKRKNVLAALGIYPLEALELSDKEIDSEIDFIRKNSKKIVGVGEVGMDFKEVKEEKKQEKNFRKFVSLSIELGKPIFVHSRKAEAECIKILEEEKAKKVVMHCFSGNFKLVKKIIDNGWFLSIPASVKRSEHFQKVVEICPIEQLLCETDSPFLHPDREWPNYPSNVIESYKKIAEIKNIKLKDAEKKIEKNYENLIA